MNDSLLTTGDLSGADAPIPLFGQWLEAARGSEPNDPSAVALATVDSNGLPDVRMVLLKAFDERGFVFYTNYESSKGRELLATGKAAMCFHWKSLRRQVRLRGRVEQTTPAEADAYFASRARRSQLGALASDQSRPLESRAVLEDKVSRLEKTYESGDIPRPAHWSGFRLVPSAIEFWQNGDDRLHDRMLFEPLDGKDAWKKTRLYP